MKKCVIVPDSFKGTMSSVEVCDVISEKVRNLFPHCQICGIPIADGGEGTVDCFVRAIGGEKRNVRVQGPFGEEIESFYGVVKGDTAVVEMAAAAGLPLACGKRDPGKASTYGVGQLIAHAVRSGCRGVILGPVSYTHLKDAKRRNTKTKNLTKKLSVCNAFWLFF